MTDFFAAYGIFLAKTITAVAAILITTGGIITLATKNKFKPKEKIVIDKINEKLEKIKAKLQDEIFSKEELKKLAKREKKEKKLNKKQEKINKLAKPRLFVLDFEGDIKASAVTNLREEITAILTIATPKDEVLVKIESHGGTIHGYGLAASQLERIRERKIPLIAAVDKIAASGGYMMAFVADRIIAAPFAIIGSIGVIAQMPNFNRLLKKHHIDYEQIMAGQYKRTLSLFGENTRAGRQKLKEEVEEAHQLFKDFVATNRPMVNIKAIATGETWYGTRAKQMRLVDEITTSDDFLLNTHPKAHIYQISYVAKKNVLERISTSISQSARKIFF